MGYRMGFVILFFCLFNIALSLVRTIHPQRLFAKNTRTRFNWMSSIGAVISVGVLAYSTVPLLQRPTPPTIKVATASLTRKSGECAVQLISVDPTDDIKDLQLDVTIAVDKPAQESLIERFTDVGRANHYELGFGMDDDCHPKISPVPFAHNLTFKLSNDGKTIRIKGQNVNNLDAGGVFVIIPGPVPASPFSPPAKLTIYGEATYDVLGSDQPATLIHQDLGLQDFGYSGEEVIKPSPNASERLIRESNYFLSRSFVLFTLGTLAQIISLWLGWIPLGSAKKPIEPLPFSKKLGQALLSSVAALLLIMSSSSATRLLSKKPTVQIMRYSFPPIQTKTLPGCAVWGFSVRTDASVNELHLAVDFDRTIHSHELTDGSEFLAGDHLKISIGITPPCELRQLPNPNAHLDNDLSSDMRQVIMYSERFTPYDRGGIVLSFYPVKEGYVSLYHTWDVSAHYQDWFGNEQKLGLEDVKKTEVQRLNELHP
jgi:hypothetical protein